jgi:hypothetical protein
MSDQDTVRDQDAVLDAITRRADFLHRRDQERDALVRAFRRLLSQPGTAGRFSLSVTASWRDSDDVFVLTFSDVAMMIDVLVDISSKELDLATQNTEMFAEWCNHWVTLVVADIERQAKLSRSESLDEVLRNAVLTTNLQNFKSSGLRMDDVRKAMDKLQAVYPKPVPPPPDRAAPRTGREAVQAAGGAGYYEATGAAARTTLGAILRAEPTDDKGILARQRRQRAAEEKAEEAKAIRSIAEAAKKRRRSSND